MLTERQIKVFDTSLYSVVPETQRPHVLTEDLAGLVIEAGDRPLEERINPRIFKVEGDLIIDLKTGESIRQEWRHETELQRRESEAANSFYDYLLKSPGNLIFSLSPTGGPGKYLEARVNVGYRKNEEEIEFYGIPSHMHSDALVNYAARLSEWNIQPFLINSPEDLRQISIPIQVPIGINPWEFLDEVAPLDSDAWRAIAKGLPWKIKEKAEIDALPIAREMSFRLISARSEIDHVQIGAWGERSMENLGWKLKASACPGLFNQQIMSMNELAISSFTKDSFGNFRLTKWEYHKGKCVNPNCNQKGETVDVGPCSICRTCEKTL